MELHELTNDAIDHILKNMETDRLNEWENEFFERVTDQWERIRRLSDKQKEILGEIWDKQP